jgi:thioredoxin-related protein
VDTDNLHIVRVALDYQSTAEVAAFIESNQVQGGVLLGNTTTAQQFKIQGYPSYYLIDQNQRVVSRAFGYSTSLGLNIRKWIH